MSERVAAATGFSVKRDRPPMLGGLAFWLLGQFRAYRSGTATAQREMRIVETLPLGGRRCLTLVECGSQRYLVASSAERVEIMMPVEGCSAEVRG